MLCHKFGSKLFSLVDVNLIASFFFHFSLFLSFFFLLWPRKAVQLTTFRPLARNKTATTAAPSPTSGSSVTPRLRVRALEASDKSDYENLSACTSGRYATLPPQPQFGTSGAGGGLYRDHYAAAAAGVVFRPHSSGAGPAGYFQQSPTGGDPLPAQTTLSLQRPVKRSHWVNHNGRPSDVLARVLQANADWLDPVDPLEIRSAPLASR